MAVTIKKKATAKATGKTAALESIIEKANALGALAMKLTPAKARVQKIEKEYKPLFSTVQEYVDDNNALDAEVTLKTDEFALTFTKHPETFDVDAAAAAELLDAVEPGLAQKLMTFSVTDLRKYLTPAQFDAVTEGNHKRSRSLKVAKIDDE